MSTDEEKKQRQEALAARYQAECERIRGKRHGVVVTPVEVVDFQVRAVITEARRVHGDDVDLARMRLLDPFGGTGIYLARFLQTVPLDGRGKIRLADQALMIEIDDAACRFAVENLRAVMEEETGQSQIVPLVCQADTFTTGDEVWDRAWRLAHLFEGSAA